jgi:hypothetical protein
VLSAQYLGFYQLLASIQRNPIHIHLIQFGSRWRADMVPDGFVCGNSSKLQKLCTRGNFQHVTRPLPEFVDLPRTMADNRNHGFSGALFGNREESFLVGRVPESGLGFFRSIAHAPRDARATHFHESSGEGCAGR